MRVIGRFGILGLACLVAVYGPAASAQAPAAAPGPAAPAPAATNAATASGFTTAQLEQLVAPIALYPDSLVTQVLMASTYPLEIVEAARWQKANEKLTGEKLEEALKDRDWDISVKAIVGIPEVLQRMNENLDWTQDLGDAFLAQQADLLDAVQRMRGKAYEAGNLKTSEQQTVTQQPDKIIVIQQSDPQVVYVPSYSPTVVYGAWSYPYWYYPPMYVPPPYGYGMMAFTAGVMWGAAWGGCNWGWGGSDIDIDIDHHNEFNRNTNRNSERTNIKSSDRAANRAGDKGGNRSQWKHNPEHRGGVNYRDSKTAQQFGGQGSSNRVTRDQARGFDRGGASASNRATGGTSAANRAGAGAGASNRATGGAGTRDVGASNRGGSTAQRGSASASQRGTSASQRASASPSRSSSASSSAWSGSRNSSFDRSSSSRGSMSRGGGYSGGGRGGGGGGRRR